MLVIRNQSRSEALNTRDMQAQLQWNHNDGLLLSETTRVKQRNHPKTFFRQNNTSQLSPVN